MDVQVGRVVVKLAHSPKRVLQRGAAVIASSMALLVLIFLLVQRATLMIIYGRMSSMGPWMFLKLF